jgi:hypothetical protein
MIKVRVIVSEVLERVLGRMTDGRLVKQYELEMDPANVLAEFDEARQVWDEYDVQFEAIGSIAPFQLYSVKTYKQEMMDRQVLLDLHEELAGEE